MKWKDIKKAFFATLIALGLALSPFTPAMAMNTGHCGMNDTQIKHDSGDKKTCCITASMTLAEDEVIFSYHAQTYKQVTVFSKAASLKGVRLDAFKRPPKA
jgi:hypothetical protein